MKRLVLPLALISFTLLSFVAPAFCQIIEESAAELSGGGGEKILAEKEMERALWSYLNNERMTDLEKARIVVEIDPDLKILIDADEAQSRAVGVHLPVDVAVRLGREKALSTSKSTASGHASGVGRTRLDSAGGLVWATSLQAQGASAVRIHFTNFQLPPRTALYLYNDAGQAHGPYTGTGPHGDGEFWSHTVFGEHVWIQLHSDDADSAKLAEASFNITDISHLGDRFEIAKLVGADADKADCSGNISCVENAECYDWDDILSSARKAVAKIIFEDPDDGLSYICSGGLLNDQDSSDRTPWFLTAHHCLSTESAANSLEALFQYQSSCGSCSGSYVDSVLGADLWATDNAGDFSLLELSELPSSWALMGWTNANVMDSDGTQLYRISHPKGKPQSFSQHEVVLHSSSKYIHTENIIGTVEGGSSGSPIFRDDSKVVGQLLGVTNDNNLCSPTTFDTLDGAFSYYWKSVRPYLGSPSNTNKMHVSAVAAGTQKVIFSLFFGKATITVVDELGNVVPFATVTGTFSGGLSGTYSGITNHLGQATILHGQLKSSKPSFTFCVTNVTQAYFSTYDSASNDVTCASR